MLSKYLPYIRKSLHSRCQPMEAISITFSLWSLIAHHAEEGGKMRCLRWFCHGYYSSQGTRWSLLTNTADGESVQVTLEGHDKIQASRTLQAWFALPSSLRSRGCRIEDAKLFLRNRWKNWGRLDMKIYFLVIYSIYPSVLRDQSNGNSSCSDLTKAEVPR
jgi:hypothetical protein